MKRSYVLLILLALFAAGAVLDLAKPVADNVTHHDVLCQHIHWDTTTASYVVTSVQPAEAEGGGCKL